MQPETILNSWREWSGQLRTHPVILKTMSGGRSNRSFLLDSDGLKMVLRINGPEKALPNSNRSSEINIWQAASQKGIAPPLLHVDEQNRFLVSAYINNSLPRQPPVNRTYVDQAFGLLKRCHQLDVKAPTIDYAGHIEHYWQIIENNGDLLNPVLKQQREPMQLVLEELINSGTETALCHHDPVVENFVGNPDRLYLIDWEYAAHGLLVIDYAALATEWEIEDAVIIKQTGIEAESLSKAKKLYKYLCKLWEEITS